jgi:hypothetical protein
LGHIGVEKLIRVWSSTAARSTMGNCQWWRCPVVVGDAEGVSELQGAKALLAGVETRADPVKTTG